MVICHLCGEEKDKKEFKNLMYFTTYKKQKVQWCKQCQRLYIDFKREKEGMEKLKQLKGDYKVSFE